MIEWSKLVVNNLNDLKTKLPDKHLEIEDGDRPNMADTIGSLIDKLSIVNIKMFWNQEILYEIRRMTQEQFVEMYGSNMSDVYKAIKIACDMNVLRNQLMDEINDRMASLVKILGGNQNDIESLRLVAPSHKSY